MGDPGRVRQVLTNLVGNAIKFTHTGEIVIRVGVTEVSAAHAVIRFEVSDTGDGIAADNLAIGDLSRALARLEAIAQRGPVL